MKNGILLATAADVSSRAAAGIAVIGRLPVASHGLPSHPMAYRRVARLAVALHGVAPHGTARVCLDPSLFVIAQA